MILTFQSSSLIPFYGIGICYLKKLGKRCHIWKNHICLLRRLWPQWGASSKPVAPVSSATPGENTYVFVTLWVRSPGACDVMILPVYIVLVSVWISPTLVCYSVDAHEDKEIWRSIWRLCVSFQSHCWDLRSTPGDLGPNTSVQCQ